MTTILIVDDDVDMRMLVRFAIELVNDGLEVVAEAIDGADAIDVWRALNGPPVPTSSSSTTRCPG